MRTSDMTQKDIKHLMVAYALFYAVLVMMLFGILGIGKMNDSVLYAAAIGAALLSTYVILQWGD